MILQNILNNCELCPLRCAANRLADETGACGAGSVPRVYSFLPHLGEEPPLSGSRGSGVVFFGACPLSCIYCQNFPWSQEGAGTDCSLEDLVKVFQELEACGCHNWNLVSPTPWLPWILEALDRLEANHVRLPVVYNTSSYERVDILKTLRGLVSIYLADLRYSTNELALEVSGAVDYVNVARAAILEMQRQVGELRLDADGLATAGLIIRVLILPGHANEAVESLVWIAENIGASACVSIMAQYTPAYRAIGKPPWNRRISRREFDHVTDMVKRLGLSNGWIQDYDCVESSEFLGVNINPIGLLRQVAI